MENNKYLNFRKLNEQETELYIYGDIRKKDWIDDWFGTGKDVTEAFSLKDALAKIDTPILTVRINSYGGSVSEGLAIYNLLQDYKGHLRTVVDGFACSAASVIFMAGAERIVPESGLLMIHNAWSRATGDSNAMKKAAEDLEKQTQPSVNIYVSKTGLSEEKVKEMMDHETWITSKEAFELGFATNLEKNDSAKQSLESDYVYNLVLNVKELEKEKQLYEKEITQLKEQVNENLPANKNNINGDAWASFFNTKK
ncbi:MAG: Clp protease ClpP [Clostridia bacterium]|jgi:ATP-dependent Clp protease protease subunit|nr:Clp protease ClpP [Clostridia bacterium]